MDDPSTGLSFQEVGIADALARWSLVVPLNQRAYEWVDQIDKLLNDLFLSFEATAQAYWPGVNADDWCGEWAAIPAPV